MFLSVERPLDSSKGGYVYYSIPTKAENDKAYDLVSEFCQERLALKYGGWKHAEDRLAVALDLMRKTGSAFQYFVLKEISELSREENGWVFCYASVSILDYLLGLTQVNPLIPHYHCPACHHIEEVDTVNDGFDLPPKACPECGADMERDGHNCSEHICWVNSRGDVRSHSQDLGVTQAVLQKLQGRLDRRFHEAFSSRRTGEEEMRSIIAGRWETSERLNRLFQTTKIAPQDIPVFEKGLWNLIARETLGEVPAFNGKEHFFDEIEFHQLSRLFGYRHGAFEEKKRLENLEEAHFYALRDEIYVSLLSFLFSWEEAACEVLRIFYLYF